jgi:hypothetical protein
MAMDFTTGYAQIIKYDKNDDGTLTVYGKATDDTLDLDSQICDPKWLDTAMPRWFKSGGNIREMHGPSAAGIAKEYEAKGDGHYINVLVVDPIAAKKVETGVYQGFSIGIKSPRVIQDSKAANGRIVDGQIIEVSLVDRPANPSAKLILAKTIEGEPSLVQVEEIIEKHGDHDQADHAGGGGGDNKPSEDSKPGGGGMSRGQANDAMESAQSEISVSVDEIMDLQSELANAGDDDSASAAQEAYDRMMDAHANLDEALNGGLSDSATTARMEDAVADLENAHSVLEGVDHGDAEDIQDAISETVDGLNATLDEIYGRAQEGKSLTNKRESKMKKIKRITTLAKSLTTVDAAKFDKSLFDNARKALAELIAAEALEMREGHDERQSLAALAGAVEALMAWYEGERHEGEVMGMETEEVVEEKSLHDTAMNEDDEKKADLPDCEDGKCGKCSKCMGAKGVEAPNSTQQLRSDQAPDTMEMNDMVDIDEKKKSADAEEVTENSATEEEAETSAEETPAEEVPTIEEIVEKAVKSAMKSVEAEMVALQADKEAAVTKAVKLETELSNALNKAVGGGPKRTATKMSDQSQNDALVKAASYKAKMEATTDPLLFKGYSELRNQELRKAGVLAEKN